MNDGRCSYPFESELFYIKKILSSGNGRFPLWQVAKRMQERDGHLSSQVVPKSMPPKCKTELKKVILDRDITADIRERLQQFSNSSQYYMYGRAEFEFFTIDTSRSADSWVLLDSGRIMKTELLITLPSDEISNIWKIFKLYRRLVQNPILIIVSKYFCI